MPCRVFIADDVEALRVLWAQFLGDDPGFEVVGEAADGEATIAGVRATRPDVLVLDLSMPKVDGLQVIQALRAEMPEVRIVVASGFLAVRLAPVALKLGATSYLEKGVSAAALREAVHAACAAGAPDATDTR